MGMIGNAPVAGIITAANIQDGAITQPKIGGNVAGTWPFLCVQSTNSPSLSAGTWTKVPFNVVANDTNSRWNSSTYTYTPDVPGYYLCTFNALCNSSGGYLVVTINKTNGGGEHGTNGWGSQTSYGQQTTTEIYCNGTTDGIYASVFSSNANTLTPYSWHNELNIALVRKA